MADTSTASMIRRFVAERYITPARRRGERRVAVVAGDVHRGLSLANRVPNVCHVLASKKIREENQVEIEEQSGPPSGMGTRMTYVYRLLDVPEADEPGMNRSFETLRGVLKDIYRSLGGGEAYLKNERAKFYPGEGKK